MPTHLGASRGPGRGTPSWSPRLLCRQSCCPCHRASLGPGLGPAPCLGPAREPVLRPNPPPEATLPMPASQPGGTLDSACLTPNPRLHPGPPTGAQAGNPGNSWPCPGPPVSGWMSSGRLCAALWSTPHLSRDLAPRPLSCSKTTLAPLFAFWSQLAACRYKASMASHSPCWPRPLGLLTHEGTCGASLSLWGRGKSQTFWGCC